MNNKLKVLFVGPMRFAPKVGEKNIKIIYPSLLIPLNGCELHLLHGMKELPEYTRELTENYGVIYHYVNKKSLLAWLIKTISTIRKHDIDVITNVFFGFRFGFISALASKFTDTSAIVRFAANEILVRECAGEYIGIRGKCRWIKEIMMQKIAIRYANQVIAMSPWEENRLKKIANIPEKVKWCMRGVDTKHYAPIHKKKYGGARKFLYVGRKVVEKGYQLIENVARKIENRFSDIEFYFAGTFDVAKEGNRHYLGYFHPERIVELYSTMDALILPSQSEGFSNAVVEAMSVGLPCIISKSFHDQYFTHQRNALLIDLTEEDLENNILKLYMNPELQREISENARQLAVNEFDSSMWAQRYSNIIFDGIKKKGDL